MATITTIPVTINIVTSPVLEWTKLLEELIQSYGPVLQIDTIRVALGDITLTLRADILDNMVKVQYFDHDGVAHGVILNMSHTTGELTAYQFSDAYDEEGAHILPINLTNGETDDILNLRLMKMLAEHPIV